MGWWYKTWMGTALNRPAGRRSICMLPAKAEVAEGTYLRQGDVLDIPPVRAGTPLAHICTSRADITACGFRDGAAVRPEQVDERRCRI